MGDAVLLAAGLTAAAVSGCALHAVTTEEPCPLRAFGSALLGITTVALAWPPAGAACNVPGAALVAATGAAALVVDTWVSLPARTNRIPLSPRAEVRGVSGPGGPVPRAGCQESCLHPAEHPVE